jgi:hypothetical protein
LARACSVIYFGLVHQEIHNVDALHYKIGAALLCVSAAPTLVPIPRHPAEVGASISSKNYGSQWAAAIKF